MKNETDKFTHRTVELLRICLTFYGDYSRAQKEAAGAHGHRYISSIIERPTWLSSCYAIKPGGPAVSIVNTRQQAQLGAQV